MHTLYLLFLIFLISACITNKESEKLSESWSESNQIPEISCEILNLKNFLEIKKAQKGFFSLVDRTEKQHIFKFDPKFELKEQHKTGYTLPKSETFLLLTNKHLISRYQEDIDSQFLILRNTKDIIDRIKIDSFFELVPSSFA